MCSFDKLTGEPGFFEAVAYISDVLKKYGVSICKNIPAYLSNPGKKCLTVDEERFPSRPRSFIEKKSLHVSLMYDPWNQRSSFYGQTEAVFMKMFRKLVLGYGYDEGMQNVGIKGAVGWIQIWTSGEDDPQDVSQSCLGTRIWICPCFSLRCRW